MQRPITLEPNQVPATLRQGYGGKKFEAVVTSEVTIPADAGLWSGGSRDLYSAVRLADGSSIEFPGQSAAPWDRGRTDRKITLEPGIVVKCHTYFSGKDLGLTFYLHPSDAAPMLPTKAELTANELLVLTATRSYKSSYMGKDRYQMAADNANPSWARAADRKPFPTRDEWNAAKASLIARGFLNRAGAITPAGRNASN
jgi:hypothetical protein